MMSRTDELITKTEFSDDDLEFIFTMTRDEYRRFSGGRSGLKRWFKEMDDRRATREKKSGEGQNTVL